VISGDEAGDQTVGSPEVKLSMAGCKSGQLRQEGKQSSRTWGKRTVVKPRKRTPHQTGSVRKSGMLKLYLNNIIEQDHRFVKKDRSEPRSSVGGGSVANLSKDTRRCMPSAKGQVRWVVAPATLFATEPFFSSSGRAKCKAVFIDLSRIFSPDLPLRP
jgi:hypothetical protein